MKNAGEILKKLLNFLVGRTRKQLSVMLKFRAGLAGRIILPVAVFFPVLLMITAVLFLLSVNHIQLEEKVAVKDYELFPARSGEFVPDITVGDSDKIVSTDGNRQDVTQVSDSVTVVVDGPSLLELCIKKGPTR